MATLYLVKTDEGHYLLQGTSDPSRNADFSLFDIDGEGGDPFAWGCKEWEIVEGIKSAEYDPDDTDTFWYAQGEIIDDAIAKGVDLPPYATEGR